MQVLKLLHEMSSEALYGVHLGRRLSVWAAVGGLLRGRRLWLTHIGRSIDSGTSEKHAIKRVDRLLVCIPKRDAVEIKRKICRLRDRNLRWVVI